MSWNNIIPASMLGPPSIQEQLRTTVRKIRVKEMPLKDLIPLLNKAADEIDSWEEVNKDHNRLVRELDVLLNGEAGAAKQASLCDIVAQVKLIQHRKRTPDRDPMCCNDFPECHHGR